VNETAHQYDMIFIDAFDEETMPVHINTNEFFVNLRDILTDDGCVATNGNLPTNDSCDRLKRALVSTFEANIFFAHSNSTENASIIISGSQLSLISINSPEQTVEKAQRLESDACLEFSLARLLSVAHRGLLTDNTTNQ
jgi:spermidine synthase